MSEQVKDDHPQPRHPGFALSTLLLSSSRALEYALAGVAGLILARTLGPEGRGLYSLITEAGGLVYAPVGLGIATAGIYLSNQRRFSQQVAFSNTMAWLLGCLAVYGLGAGLLLATRRELFGLGDIGVAVVIVGGALGLFRFAFRDFLAAQGRITAVALIDAAMPIARLTGVALLLSLAILDTESAVLAWLMALVIQVAGAMVLLSKRLSLNPTLHFGALRQQLWYGARGHAGWLLQSLNHRFDVFILAYFSGSATVGYYAVAFNLAESTWWIPLALGTALFPRASSLQPAENASLTASVMRRSLPLILVSVLAMMLVGQPLIVLLYGSEFSQSVIPFLVLAPSGLFYTVTKLLATSLTAQGRPQASLYGGMISVPIMIGANIVLIPWLDATGAALASNLAYAVYAAYLVWYFRSVTRLTLRDVFLPTRVDLIESARFAHQLLGRITGRLRLAIAPGGETKL